MEKLELKHLAPYLPYGLKMEHNKKIKILVGTQYHLSQIGIDFCIENKSKPFLLPMIYLKKHPFNEMLNLFVDDNEFNIEKLEMFVLGRWQPNPNEWPYMIIQFLLEHHFDVFNLIPAGLAIDKTTL